MTESAFPQMLPIHQAAAVSGLAAYRVRQLCKQNTIAHVMCGKRCMVNMRSLADFCNAGSAPESTPNPGGIARIKE